MKVFAVALLAIVAPTLILARDPPICYPPQSTTIGFLTLSEAKSYSINDYVNGILYFAPVDDIFNEPWTLVDLNQNITYHKEAGRDCVYQDMDPEVRELLDQCIPDDAQEHGSIDGHPIYLTDRPGSIKWLMAVTPIEDSPYFWRFISRFEYRGSLTDVGFVWNNHLGILEPSLLDKDLSVCVPSK